MSIKREYNLCVNVTSNYENNGKDNLQFTICFNYNNKIDKSVNLVFGEKESFLKAIFDVNHNNSSYSVSHRAIFNEVMILVTKYFCNDCDIVEAFDGIDFSNKFELERYAIAYITLYAWIKLSKDFEEQNKKMMLYDVNYLDEIYINEFINRILKDETEYICGIDLYATFHDIFTLRNIHDETNYIYTDNILNEFIAAVYDMIFVSEEEYKEYEEYHELSNALDKLTSDIEAGDIVVIKAKSEDNDDEPKGPIN